MKKLLKAAFFFSALVFFSVSIKAFPTKIVAGELFVGGSAFQTPGYQNYLAFYMLGETRFPNRQFEIFGEQTFSVFQNHPINPNGFYKFTVQMPYHANAMRINGELYSPVWYVNSRWTFEGNLVTPTGSSESPQFINAQAPFKMNGIVVSGGAYNSNFKISGAGIIDIKFEKFGTKYYLREARYTFADTEPKAEKTSEFIFQ